MNVRRFLWVATIAIAAACSAGAPVESGDGGAMDASADSTTDVASDTGAGGDADAGGQPLLEDFMLGPYGSAYSVLLAVLEYGKKYDVKSDYRLEGAEAYLVEASARLLHAGRGKTLPGGDADRKIIVDQALAMVDNYLTVDSMVLGGGPGWGLPDAWDAFGDGTQNPPWTEYAWETGLAVRAMVDLAAELLADPVAYASYQSQASSLMSTAKSVLDIWHKQAWSDLSAISHPEWGFYWYSLSPNDAIAVYNTTALLSEAETVVAETVGPSGYDSHAAGNFGYFAAGSLQYVTATDSYAWNYAGQGYPHAPSVEDSSHGSFDEDWLRFGLARGELDATHAKRIQNTLLDVMYAGNPAHLAGHVDGTSPNGSDWSYTPACAIGISVWGDALPSAQGGLVELWELARNVYFSGELERHDRPLASPIESAFDGLVLANLFDHRPAELAPDSLWVMHAGDAGDNAAPQSATGGVRFHPADWSAPSAFADAALPNQPAFDVRTSTATNANVFVDLPSADLSKDVVVSLVYRSAQAGLLQQWDGGKYVTLGTLPATTVPEQTVPVFFRTTFRLNRAQPYFDYQGSAVPGTNVLLQLTASGVSVYSIEATPF